MARGGSYGEAKNDGLGVNNKEERARNTAARKTMKTSKQEIRDTRKKQKRGKGGGISFVTPETERCQRARPLIDAPAISTRQASCFSSGVKPAEPVICCSGNNFVKSLSVCILTNAGA